jgi:hypothetical protein
MVQGKHPRTRTMRGRQASNNDQNSNDQIFSDSVVWRLENWSFFGFACLPVGREFGDWNF